MSSKSGSYINYSGSRDITISAGTTNVYGDLDTKGKLILQSSPEFKTNNPYFLPISFEAKLLPLALSPSQATRKGNELFTFNYFTSQTFN